jgi:hypothetical protein
MQRVAEGEHANVLCAVVVRTHDNLDTRTFRSLLGKSVSRRNEESGSRDRGSRIRDRESGIHDSDSVSRDTESVSQKRKSVSRDLSAGRGSLSTGRGSLSAGIGIVQPFAPFGGLPYIQNVRQGLSWR